MKTWAVSLKGIVAAAAALAAGLAAAAPTLSTEYRYAAQLSEYFVRGDAAVSESTVLRRGLRLAAWDAADEQEATRVAVATAAYFFQVPLAARAVTIEVAYRADAAAADKRVAGFLFVRNRAIEEQFAEANKEGARPAEEPGFFGSTYFLPANETRATFTLPAENHVNDGVLEVHLSAGAGQVFDAQYVQVTALGAEAAIPIQYAPPTQYIADPYQYTYYYYYSGPCYYPMGVYYASFYPFGVSIDPIFWWGWHTRRACYHHHHHWVHRPHHYHHHPIVVCRPSRVASPLLAEYRGDWYRRHFAVDARRLDDRELDRLARRRVELLSPERLVEQRRYAQLVAENVRETDRQFRTRTGERFADHLATWQRDPGKARRELRDLDRSPLIERASSEWGIRRNGERRHIPTQDIRPGTAPVVTPSIPQPTTPSPVGKPWEHARPERRPGRDDSDTPRIAPPKSEPEPRDRDKPERPPRRERGTTPSEPPAVAPLPQPPPPPAPPAPKDDPQPKPRRERENRQDDDPPKPRRERDDPPRPRDPEPSRPGKRGDDSASRTPSPSFVPTIIPRRETMTLPAPTPVERPARPRNEVVERTPRVIERPAPAPVPQIVERTPRVIERPAPAPAPQIIERTPRVIERPAPAPAPQIIERPAPREVPVAPRAFPERPTPAPQPAQSAQPQYGAPPAPVYGAAPSTDQSRSERRHGRDRSR